MLDAKKISWVCLRQYDVTWKMATYKSSSRPSWKNCLLGEREGAGFIVVVVVFSCGFILHAEDMCRVSLISFFMSQRPRVYVIPVLSLFSSSQTPLSYNSGLIHRIIFRSFWFTPTHETARVTHPSVISYISDSRKDFVLATKINKNVCKMIF